MSAIAPVAQAKHSSSLEISDAGITVTAVAASGSQPSGHQPSGSKASGSKLSSQTGRVAPSDCVRLDVLLITGQRKFFDFAPQTSVKEVREAIWSEWPQDWPPRPMTASSIRVLHLGHILDDWALLCPADGSSSRGMSVGKSTVVHLLLRQAPTKADGDEDSLKKEVMEPGCCGCVVC